VAFQQHLGLNTSCRDLRRVQTAGDHMFRSHQKTEVRSQREAIEADVIEHVSAALDEILAEAPEDWSRATADAIKTEVLGHSAFNDKRRSRESLAVGFLLLLALYCGEWADVPTEPVP